MTAPTPPAAESTCGCGHSKFAHVVTRLNRRGRCTKYDAQPCPCARYVAPKVKPAAEPRVFMLPAPPPRGDDVLLEDRHGGIWIPHGQAEWRRPVDGFITTWSNLLGVHGPVTLKTQPEPTRAH